MTRATWAIAVVVAAMGGRHVPEPLVKRLAALGTAYRSLGVALRRPWIQTTQRKANTSPLPSLLLPSRNTVTTRRKLRKIGIPIRNSHPPMLRLKNGKNSRCALWRCGS